MGYYEEERKKKEQIIWEIKEHNDHVAGKIVKIEKEYYLDIFDKIKTHQKTTDINDNLNFNFECYKLKTDKDKKVDELRKEFW